MGENTGQRTGPSAGTTILFLSAVLAAQIIGLRPFLWQFPLTRSSPGHFFSDERALVFTWNWMHGLVIRALLAIVVVVLLWAMRKDSSHLRGTRSFRVATILGVVVCIVEFVSGAVWVACAFASV